MEVLLFNKLARFVVSHKLKLLAFMTFAINLINWASPSESNCFISYC